MRQSTGAGQGGRGRPEQIVECKPRSCSWWAPATSPPVCGHLGKILELRATADQLPGNNCTCPQVALNLHANIFCRLSYVMANWQSSVDLGCKLQRRCNGQDTLPSPPLEHCLSRVHVQEPEINCELRYFHFHTWNLQLHSTNSPTTR